MNRLVSLIILFLGTRVLAIPVINENHSSSGMITIYQDHKNLHQYYIAPNVVTIARNEEGIPHFSYAEYKRKLVVKVGVLQMTLMPAYTREDMQEAMANILKKDPEAQFSGLPFVESSLALTGELPQLIESHQCNHAGGLIGQEQACAMVLTSKGRSLFLLAVERKTLFLTLQFMYKVAAVKRAADGSFRDQDIEHGMAVRIDGDLLARYPKLIKSY